MSFNHELLRRLVTAKRTARGLGYREAGAEIGLSFRTLFGFESEGRTPKMCTAQKLAEWVGVPLEMLREGSAVGCLSDAPTPDKIDAAISADGSLSREGAALLSTLMRTAYRRAVER